jgi:(5-formylfuran-3-yl)methyl phosphate synthase
MTQLLVSVRSAEEATLAVQAGVGLIDVKDPSRGALGMAHHETVAAVLKAVDGAVPVSAALGEWHDQALDEANWHLGLPLAYVKWGQSNTANVPEFGEALLQVRRQLPTGLEMVCVAYVDHAAAKSTAPAELVKFAKRFRFKAFLFDTFDKSGGHLLDHLSVAELTEYVTSLHRSQIQVALGGSLKFEHVAKLKPVQADWLAVRGAVCVGGKRDGDLDDVRLAKWVAAVG